MFFKLLFALSAISAAKAGTLGRYATIVDRETVAANKYDFIIAGGGIAGLTIADRLTENPSTSVLVVEFGPFDRGEGGVLVPGLYFPVPYFWPALLSTPQPGLNNGVFFVPTAAVVGGGSTINAMFFLRCAKEEYDTWEALGNNGWAWKDLLPYFKKSENFTAPTKAYANAHNITWDNSVHGFNGPVQASFPNYEYPAAKNFWNAAVSLGIPTPKDPNGGDAVGLYSMLKSLDPRTKTRSYARPAHYDRVINSRPNYHLIAEHSVSKVLFEGKKAVGIEYIARSDGTKFNATAKKEVILAAGSVHSPQILQLSGIGPTPLLQSLGIPTLVNLPGVGANLQDHLVLTVNYNYTSNLHPNGGDLNTDPAYDAQQYALYNASQPSAYTLTRGTDNQIVLLPLKLTTTAAKTASIIALAKSQNAASLLPAGTDASVIKGYKAQREKLYKHYASLETSIGSISWSTGPTTAVYMIKPFSRGSIKIASTDPLANPLIDFGALIDPTDLEVVLALVRRNRAIMATPYMQVLGPTELAPTSANLVTDEELKSALRSSLQPSNAHQCCTTAMLGKDLGGVVDVDLLVYGVNRLSVVGASVWPMTPAGAPQATVYGAAEKSADIIKKRHGLL